MKPTRHETENHDPANMTADERLRSGCYLCQIFPKTPQEHQWPPEAVEQALRIEAERQRIIEEAWRDEWEEPD